MAPLTKESIEFSTSVGELPGAGAGTQPKQAAGHLRSDAISLEIAVKVHGSRVTEVVREVTPHTEPFEEQTSTMIVFPQGAVLRMSTTVTMGQMLVVTNSKTKQDAICRVVKVRTFSAAQGYVEIEFSRPQPGYWGVHFPGDASGISIKPAPVPSPAIQREEPKKVQASDISAAPRPDANTSIPKSPIASNSFKQEPGKVAPPSQPVPSARPNTSGSSFILIGSQEETQPAASSTSRASGISSAPPRIEPEREARVSEPAKKTAPNDFPAAPPSAPVPSLSMAELLGDEMAAPVQPSEDSTTQESALEENGSSVAAESAVKNSHSTFGSLSGGATLGASHSQHSEIFGTLLDTSLGDLTAASSVPRQKNWALIAVCILVVFAGVVGGAFYFRQQLGLQKTDQKVAVSMQTSGSQGGPIDANGSSSTQLPSTQGNQSASNTNLDVPKVTLPGTTVTVSANPVQPAASAAVHPSASAPNPSSAPSAAPKPKGSGVTSGMLASTMNAHPVSSSRAGTSQAMDAPSIDSNAIAANSDAALPVSPSSADIAAPPPPVPAPSDPLKVGGEVKQPRLINLKQPIYPLVAKEAHIQGDVVITTQIDKVGNVVHMQVVSGPTMLRQPALEALRQWKYAPSTLNGQPVSVEMLVTLKFRM